MGERQKKAKNIIHPTSAKRIADFLSDDTRFASFSPPGIYERETPKPVFLSRFGRLDAVTARRVRSRNPDSEVGLELELVFSRPSDREVLRLIVGGLDPQRIPAFAAEENHRGFQMPLGIGNHSFYEPYRYAIENRSNESPYYGLLLDEAGGWLDGSVIGIDGTLMHSIWTRRQDYTSGSCHSSGTVLSGIS